MQGVGGILSIVEVNRVYANDDGSTVNSADEWCKMRPESEAGNENMRWRA